ncbi:MAG: hypothetical protein E5W83_33760 [Mesorhizobium sp.]|nr:MAG: hypothetical protein E5W83_33760 [Mesorhizobium sp.]
MRSIAFRIAVLVLAMPYGSATAATCYHVVNVDFWDVLYIRTQPSHLSRAAGAIAPDHYGIIVATGPCKPAGADRKRQWCPVTYYPLPSVSRHGYVKAYFVETAACPDPKNPVAEQ